MPDDDTVVDYCPKCGDNMDTNCMGNPRCPTCDPPCVYCDDGARPDLGGSE